MLTVTKLRDADYLINQVAVGLDDYYLGRGEAPGVWHGAWAKEFGLEAMVDHDDLRPLLEGRHPSTGADLLAGRPMREVAALDATFSAPKSASLLWAFASPEVAAAVSIAHVEAVAAALDVLEAKAGVARQQVGGVRRRVATSGLAVATFVHRTSREGDPQLHTHCVIPNLVARADGTHVALDAGAIYEWKRAVGCIYAEELRTRLTRRLGVEWGPDRNGTREMVGLSAAQLRAFSKRTVAIEEHLADLAIDHADRAAAMRADEAASLATRPAKDPSRTPQEMAATWAAEAAAVDLPTGAELTAAVCGRDIPEPHVAEAEVTKRLLDPEEGLCARRARFGEAHVVEAVASLGGGRLEAAEILARSRDFLASDHAVRLVETEPDACRAPVRQWSTADHVALERHVLEGLHHLGGVPVAGVEAATVEAAIAAEGSLGADQADAVSSLCAPGPALRLVAAPAGFGKTTAVHAAAVAQTAAGRRVLGLATTNQAAAELRDVGIPAVTLARARIDVEAHGLAPNTTLVLDEISQVATADAAWLVDMAAAVPGTTLWCLGDARQGRAVRAGGLGAELERLAGEGRLPAATLRENRRQRHAAERAALARYRAGAMAESQAIRTEAGWEHDCGTPSATRDALARAVLADADAMGEANVVALCVSHADAEDLADRVRAFRAARGELAGPTLSGPGWGSGERPYAAGDLVLVHANARMAGRRLHNGTVLTVTGVTEAGLTVSGLTVSGPAGRGSPASGFVLPASFVTGRRSDGAPNLSHAVARTVDGAQGGTWERVHLLGTAALDRYSAYVGQSRGRDATHTWNVTRLADVDHGGLIVTRDPAEEVLSAMERQPTTAFAAHGDPYLLDRELNAERSAHDAVIATRPRAVIVELAKARDILAKAEAEATDAAERLASAEVALSSLGPLSRLRRHGRREIERAQDRVEQMAQWRDKAEAALRRARADTRRLERAGRESITWALEHGWRVDRVAEIDRQLDHHWAAAVVAATRQGDPLAFGIERLRRARRTVVDDLRAVEAALPPDHEDLLSRAEADVARYSVGLDHARKAVTAAECDLESASRRRWGRRDHEAMAVAEAGLTAAKDNVERAEEKLAKAGIEMAEHRQAVARRAEALESTAPERQRLAAATKDLVSALVETRPGRVAAAAHGDPEGEHLVMALGRPPSDPAARAVWCGIATEVEACRDAYPEAPPELGRRPDVAWLLGPRPAWATNAWDGAAGLVNDAPYLLEKATTIRGIDHDLEDPRFWRDSLDRSVELTDAARPTREIEGPSLGLSL